MVFAFVFVFPALLSGPERLRGERWGLSRFQQLSRHKLTWDISCFTGLAVVWARFHKELSETLSISEICFVFTTQKEREEISGQWIGQASAALLRFCLSQPLTRCVILGKLFDCLRAGACFICKTGRTIPTSEGFVRFKTREVLPSS